MRIGELKNKDMQVYRQQSKIEALKAAKKKAEYWVEALGKRLGDVIRIVEPQESAGYPRYFAAQSNVSSSQAEAYDAFRTIKTELFDAGEVRDKVESYGKQRNDLFLHLDLIQVVSPVFQIAHTAVSMQFIQ